VVWSTRTLRKSYQTGYFYRELTATLAIPITIGCEGRILSSVLYSVLARHIA
jgi:hypothetical protein